eukprot:2266976-Pleurochrysis_carterae.AAC.1
MRLALRGTCLFRASRTGMRQGGRTARCEYCWSRRPPNLQLPVRITARGKGRGDRADGEADEEEEAFRIELPSEFSRFKRMHVQLGKFGLADDFSFEEHNSTSRLCTLDPSVPNCYVNPLLLMLALLPWVEAHCLSRLSRSQFSLADELGFLFHMMRRSAGSCCQPRNFQRALQQSREATALQLTDAVDVEGNMKAAGLTLCELMCKFCPFLLEQLNKEDRAAQQ